jgi:hypothetical protein
MTSLLLAGLLATTLAPQHDQPTAPKPWRLLTLRVSPVTAFPDFLSASVTLNAPYVDVEGGAGFAGLGATAFVRAGPRFSIKDWRDLENRGWALESSVLVGYKMLHFWETHRQGMHAVATIDATRWFASHLGVSFQLALGATYDPRLPPVIPDARLAIGLAF